MPRVVDDGTFVAYVYANEHNPPHCHVYWNGDENEAIVDLRSLLVFRGDALPKNGKKLIRSNAEELREMWNRLHPDNPIQEGE
jgi:hypothetical protein